MRHRAAFTLVELLISMSVGATLMALAIGAVHRTMNLETSAKKQQAGLRAASQLSRQFRRDVHRATKAATDGENVTLLVETPTGPLPTTYTVAGGIVIREQIVEEGRHHREEYHFGSRAVVELSEISEPRRLVLTIRQSVPSRNTPPRVLLHCEAVVGRLIQAADSTIGRAYTPGHGGTRIDLGESVMALEPSTDRHVAASLSSHPTCCSENATRLAGIQPISEARP